mgnify:CR=1 FL=1
MEQLWTDIQTLFTGPYAALVGGAVIVAYHWAKAQWPNAPILSWLPSLLPVVEAAAGAPSAQFPLLTNLVQSAGVAPAATSTDLTVDQLTTLRNEIAGLIGQKTDSHATELAALQQAPAASPPAKT